MSILQKAAEILIEHGYAYRKSCTHDNIILVPVGKIYHDRQYINPFANTFEGICQLHAIENWLHRNKQGLLIKCKDAVQDSPLSEYDGYEKRKKRIEWCLVELDK